MLGFKRYLLVIDYIFLESAYFAHTSELTLPAVRQEPRESKEKNDMIAVFSVLLKDKMNPGYKAEILYDKPVPVNVLKLWIERSYDPIETGVAHVNYPDSENKYVFPAFFKVDGTKK